jgi:hypothetical protein
MLNLSSRMGPNPAAPVDAPTRVCLRWSRLGRRATEQHRYRDMKLHPILLGWSNPDQALRVAAGILGKRASGGTTWALQVRCQGCEAFPTMYRTWKPQSGLGLESEDMVKRN